MNLGTEIDAITHRGYRLALPSSALATEGVLAAIAPDTRARLREGQCLPEIDSTNSALLKRAPPTPGHFDFMTAEYQSAAAAAVVAAGWPHRGAPSACHGPGASMDCPDSSVR